LFIICGTYSYHSALNDKVGRKESSAIPWICLTVPYYLRYRKQPYL